MVQLLFLASQGATSRRTSSSELPPRHISMRVLLLRMAGAQAFGTPSLTQGKCRIKAQAMSLPMGTTSTREDFTAYADVCFREFGDRVSHWTTTDEPNAASIGSYDHGQTAPGRCSDPFGQRKCTVGDSTAEPYISVHNMLLAHASAARLYRGKYQAVQKGIVGINVYTFWTYPLTNSTIDLEATRRCQDFMFGWILEPLVFGDYPHVMKEIDGSRLPSFTKVQYEAVRGSIDFIGINHYYSLYVNGRPLNKGVRDYTADMSVYYRASKTDQPFGQYAPTSVPNDPEGLQLALQYLKESYGDLPIYIQENGKSSFQITMIQIFGSVRLLEELHREHTGCIKEWSQCQRLLRLGLQGRLRVPVRVSGTVRPVRRRFRRRGTATASQALCSLVLQLPQEQWDPYTE